MVENEGCSTVKNGVYNCKTCGKVATSSGHLCNPVPHQNTVSCGYCGETESDARHVCAPKVSNFSYSCNTCGRVAVSDEEVCMPRKIPSGRSGSADKGGCCHGGC